MFENQLNSFKENLVSLYRRKTKLVAEREALRFQYATGVKAEILGVISAIYNQIFADRNPEGELLTRHVIEFIQSHIPMLTINGAELQGWAGNPYNMGGRFNVGYLSPTAHLISEPFGDPSGEDQSPFYKLYAENAYLYPTVGLDWVLENYFLFGNQSNMSNPVTGEPEHFEIPPSLGWVEAFATWHIHDASFNLLEGYEYMVSVLTRNYPAGNLADVIDKARTVLSRIIESTKNVLRIQLDIDQIENDLAIFVTEYKDYVGGTTIDEILTELMLESQKSESIPLPEATMEHSVITTNVAVPSVEAQPVAVIQNVPSSKLPWVAAAAAAFFLLKGK